MSQGITVIPGQLWQKRGTSIVVKIATVVAANVKGGYNVFFQGPGKNPISICTFLEEYDGVDLPRDSSQSRGVNGDVMRMLRHGRGWSLEELAVQIFQITGHNVSKQALSQIERGKNGASSITLNAIARTLGVRPSDLKSG